MKWWPHILAIAGFAVFLTTLLDSHIAVPIAQKGLAISAAMMGVGTFGGIRLVIKWRGSEAELSWSPPGRHD